MLDYVKGVNLGNWLVLERWMQPEFFETSGTEAEDEVWLTRDMDESALREKLTRHRDTYVTEEDFRLIASHGANLVRIPVPFFIFNDRPPFQGCLSYLDDAMQWAHKYGLQVMIDLHTVPGSQNGYDNGGLTGVCKWCKDPAEVEFALTVLERLSKRYGKHPALYGIEVLNEPISWLVYVTAPSTGKARDKEEAKGSGHVPTAFLKSFYKTAYKRMRHYLPEDKVIVFHDGFRLGVWKDFFVKAGMKNVALDTHIYLFAMETFCPIHATWVYKLYMEYNRHLIRKTQKHTPVITGEWCISTSWARKMIKKDPEEARRRFRTIADLQMDVWKDGAGYCYWNYQLYRDNSKPFDNDWLNGWALNRAWTSGWMPDQL